jgi:phosphoribosyl 1,2-cyclic phosphate phosphodiesterase
MIALFSRLSPRVAAYTFALLIVQVPTPLTLTFTFLGTGTSQGVPVISCRCPVCQSADPRDQRLRTSGLLQGGETSLVFDTGPDFRQQMLREQVDDLSAVVFTHQHKDHTAGLDDVRAYNYLQRKDMPIFTTEAVEDHLRKEYYYIFEQPDYPGVPKLQLNRIDPAQSFRIGDLTLTPIPMWHGKMPVLGYRCGDFAYLTDVNRIPAESMHLLQGVKTIALDALRRKPHHSHFTLTEAVDIARELGAEQTWLLHISHLMGTHAETEAELPPNVRLAYDGLRLGIEEA